MRRCSIPVLLLLACADPPGTPSKPSKAVGVAVAPGAKRPTEIAFETLSRSHRYVQLKPRQTYRREGYVGGEHGDLYFFNVPSPSCYRLEIIGEPGLQPAVAPDVGARDETGWRLLPLEAPSDGLHEVTVHAHPAAAYTITVRPCR